MKFKFSKNATQWIKDHDIKEKEVTIVVKDAEKGAVPKAIAVDKSAFLAKRAFKKNTIYAQYKTKDDAVDINMVYSHKMNIVEKGI